MHIHFVHGRAQFLLIFIRANCSVIVNQVSLAPGGWQLAVAGHHGGCMWPFQHGRLQMIRINHFNIIIRHINLVLSVSPSMHEALAFFSDFLVQKRN